MNEMNCCFHLHHTDEKQAQNLHINKPSAASIERIYILLCVAGFLILVVCHMAVISLIHSCGLCLDGKTFMVLIFVNWSQKYFIPIMKGTRAVVFNAYISDTNNHFQNLLNTC